MEGFRRMPYHPRRLIRTLAGFVVIYVAFDATARLTNSVRGEGGVPCFLATMLAALAVEWMLFKNPPVPAGRKLGFVRPKRRALTALAATAGPLLLVYPTFSIATGVPVGLRSDWLATAFGVFLQGGLGEEVLWRGYLYRRLREGRSFGRAALWTMVVTTAAHLPLLGTLDLPVAIVDVAGEANTRAAVAWAAATIVFPLTLFAWRTRDKA
jgi:membrane protease YdiL (CAAX protease family)